MDTGTVLQRARTRAGLTQAELAARAGTSQATLSLYENGRKAPSVATFERLLAATGARLAVEHGHPPLTIPSRRQVERVDRTLQDVLALAAALPVRHDVALSYPPLR